MHPAYVVLDRIDRVWWIEAVALGDQTPEPIKQLAGLTLIVALVEEERPDSPIGKALGMIF